MARQISRQDFEARFPQRLPDEPTRRDVVGFMEDTVAFNGIYADLRRAGLTHEDATIAAQRAITGEVRSTDVLPENDNNRAIAGLPPQGAIPREQRIAQLTPEQVQAYLLLQQRLSQQPAQQKAPAQTPQPVDARQLALGLQAVTRSRGRFSSPTKITNAPSPEALAAAISPRAIDLPLVAAGDSPDQLPLNLGSPLPGTPVEPAPAATTEKPASRLAQLQDAVENAVNQSPEWAQSGLRLAGRWSLPALAGLAGFSALTLLTGPEQRSYQSQEQQEAGAAPLQAA